MRRRGGAATPATDARVAALLIWVSPAHAISDIISDFLYYEEELKVKAPARPIATVVAGIGERFLGLVDTDDGVRVWDFETGAQIVVDGRRPSGARAVFPNQRGANLIVVHADGRIDETVGMAFATKGTLLAAGAATDAVAVSARAPVVAAAGGGQLQVYNLVTKHTVAVALTDRPTALEVSDDGRFVAYASGAIARVLDLDQPKPAPLEAGAAMGELQFYADSSGALGLALQDSPTHLTLYRYDGRGFARAGEHAFGSAPDRFWIRSERQMYWIGNDTINAAPLGAGRSRAVFKAKEAIAYVRSLKSGEDLLVVQRSGTLGVLSAETGKFVATAISTANGWAVIDAQKRYDGSTSGGREISWVVQKTELDLEKFARHFYEPGLLLHYVGQQQLAFASQGHRGPVPAPPSISDLQLLENVAGSGKTVALATARTLKGDIAAIEIYHNGKRVADTARISDESKRQDEINFRSTGFEIHPVPGPNTVAVVGVGSLGIEGPTREMSFERPGAARRALHVVAVGIDRYRAPSLKLNYARGDAEAVARVLRSSKGFERVAVTELYDADAGRDAVLSKLREIGAAATPGDTILVYLAGHGIAMQGGWFFVSPDVGSVAEAEIVRLSISAEQIAGILQEAKASRIVLMIDACNSGAVVKDVKGLAQNRVYTQLGRTTGFAVLAASRTEQAALERATLGHGVFTAATIAALSGDADRNGDARVTAREMATYLSRQIPTLATEHLNEVQIPVAYAPTEDFVVRALR